LTCTGIDQIVCEKTVGASYGDAFLAALSVKLDRKAHDFPLINRLA
jgi:xylulokinase